ncbi:ABC transporter permease [bacterium]|nr:ABC transporter permease [bacterium]
MSDTNTCFDAELFRKRVEQHDSDTIHRPSLTYLQDATHRLFKNRIAMVGLLMILLLIVLAIIGPMVVPFEYDALEDLPYLTTGENGHIFGTDGLGRDLWARLWMGARTSLLIGFTAAIVNAVMGTFIGSISGYFGGIVDTVLMRLIDVLYGIPYIIVAILMMVVMGPGFDSLIIALIIIGWISTARLVRGQILQLNNQEFILAARKLGSSHASIIFRHMVPNFLGLIITSMTMAIPYYIFAEAFLSYIGLGIQPPESSWGVLAKEGVEQFQVSIHLIAYPALIISIAMLSFNLFGDGLRDALDPKMRQ